MKRICTLVLAVMLVLTCTAFIFGVSAGGSDYNAVITTTVDGKATTKLYKGDTVTVTITIKDIVASGINAVGLTLNFDVDAFTYVADSANVSVYPAGWEKVGELPVKTTDLASGKIEYSPCDQLVNENAAKADGACVLVAKFTVKDVKKTTTFSCTDLTGTDPSVNAITGTSTPLSVDVDQKRPQTAPNAPTLASCTDTTITLATVSGYEYKCGDGVWQTSATFTGLTPYTDYTFYQRKAETAAYYASDDSASATLKTDKTTPPAPTYPTAYGQTTPLYGENVNTATFTLTDGTTSLAFDRTASYEYSKDGTTWQDSNTFTGLTAGSTYTFYRRVKAGASWNASASSTGLKVTLNKIVNTVTPVLPDVAVDGKGNDMIYANSITLVSVSGYEYNVNGLAWQDSPVFNGLIKDTEYTFYQRIKATSTTKESVKSTGVVVKTLNVFTPDAPVLDNGSPVVVVAKKDSTSITLKVIAYSNEVQFAQKMVCEYSKDGINWQSSNVFKKLFPNKDYTFYVRYAAIDNICYASAASEGKTFRTVCDHATTKVDVVKQATCTAAGESLTLCAVCGDVVARNAIPALGHTFGEWTVTVPATYDKAGTQTRTCTVCGEVETKEVSILTCNHDKTTAKVVKAAECEATGTTEYYCDMCGKLVKTETVAALGHKAGEWTVEKEATETEEGKKVKKCTVCGKVVEEETIAKKVAETSSTTDPAKDDGKKNNTGLIAGIIGGVVVLGGGAAIGITAANKKKKAK